MRAVAYFALGLSVAACASKSNDPDTSTAAAFCESYADAVVDNLIACAGVAASSATRSYWRSSLTKECPDVEKAVAAGRMAFDASEAAACVKSSRDLDCGYFGDNWVPLPVPECKTVLEGTVAPGGICYLDDECDGGRCDQSTCPGTCVAVPQLGEGDQCIHVDGACGPSLYCDAPRPGAPLTCAPVIPTAAENEPCLPVDYGTGVQSCLPGLYCAGSQGAFTCQPKQSSGPCESCTAGLTCSKAAGNVCVPYLALGQDCSDELGECIDGLCNDSGKCANLPTVGQDCTQSSECADGWCDAENTGNCMAYVPIGQDCGTPSGLNAYPDTCESFATCVDNICQAACREP